MALEDLGDLKQEAAVILRFGGFPKCWLPFGGSL